MEMESSRRPPFDRSRDLVKKPRLTDELTLAGRQFQAPSQPQRPVNAPVPGVGLTRFRASDRDREPEDPVRGALQQYQQHQELVNQYKTALAELTFNSKPIITNLTIIAGENLQAAKAIAATICSNILEVPSEQKLPSLYLLDSIVKNIARDYIKYFAARLPEVFCKAYRQVDPSIHPGMRHLFGTWKGVFPPQSLQIIEKELGFPASVNGPSSGSAASKPDSQSQRQPRSIHVNPKYLEARQRLQQSNRSKGTEIGGANVESSEDVERPDRTAGAGAGTGRLWAGPSTKMHNIQRLQRETLKEPSQQKQGVTGYGDHKFASGVSRPLSTPVGKPSERLIGQDYDKRWFGTGQVESFSSERNGYDVKRGISSHTLTRSTSGNVLSMQNSLKSGAETSKSWKNSEEEEYMWDDLGTSITDSTAIPVTKRDVWSSDDLAKLDYNPQELGSHHPKWQSQNDIRSSLEREPSADALSYEEKEQGVFGHPRSTQWKMQGPRQIDSPCPLLQQVGAHSVTGASSAGFSGFGFSKALPGSARSIGKRHTSPGESVMHQCPPSPPLSKRDPRQSLAAKDYTRSHSLSPSDPRTASFPGQLNVGLHDQFAQNAMPGQQQNLQSDSQGQSNVSSLLAAVMKSGLLSGGSASGEPMIEPSAPSLLTSQTTLTGFGASVTTSGLSHDSVTTPAAQRKLEKLLPLPVPLPGLSSVNSKAAQTSDVAGANSNPLSSLISTLMAKGLITASKTESTAPTPVQSKKQTPTPIPVQSKNQTPAPICVQSKNQIPAPIPVQTKNQIPAPIPVQTKNQIPARIPVQTKNHTPEQSSMVVTAAPIPVQSKNRTPEQSPMVAAAAPIPVQSKNQTPEQSPIATAAPVTVSSAPKTSSTPQASNTEKLYTSETTGKISGTSAHSTTSEIENLIGFEFRPPVLLRELHPAVIDRLLENLPHRCTVCGIQFKLQESLDRHSEWHAFRNSIPTNLNRPSRRWYSNSVDWITGKAGFPFGYNSWFTEEHKKTGEDEKMVPADESHCVCLLCGEVFEDIYSQERDEWMFKGAVHLSIPSGSNERECLSESGVQNLIVHATCVSDDSVRDLGLISDVKMEKGP